MVLIAIILKKEKDHSIVKTGFFSTSPIHFAQWIVIELYDPGNKNNIFCWT
jgi:hypothetical protein